MFKVECCSTGRAEHALREEGPGAGDGVYVPDTGGWHDLALGGKTLADRGLTAHSGGRGADRRWGHGLPGRPDRSRLTGSVGWRQLESRLGLPAGTRRPRQPCRAGRPARPDQPLVGALSNALGDVGPPSPSGGAVTSTGAARPALPRRLAASSSTAPASTAPPSTAPPPTAPPPTAPASYRPASFRPASHRPASHRRNCPPPGHELAGGRRRSRRNRYPGPAGCPVRRPARLTLRGRDLRR